MNPNPKSPKSPKSPKNFIFFKELVDGQYIVMKSLSKTKARSLYNEALKDFGDVVRACGWEQALEPLSLSQQIKFKKAGIL